MKKDLLKNILEELCSIADDMFTIFSGRQGAYQILRNNFGSDCSPDNCSKYFHDLQRRGYITVSKQSVVLTDKAKIKVIEKTAEKVKKDGLYRFVSFDVPENFANKRNAFRKILKRMGFVEIQKSLWVTDKDFGELVDIIAKRLEIEDYVAYIISQNTNINNFIKNKLSH